MAREQGPTGASVLSLPRLPTSQQPANFLEAMTDDLYTAKELIEAIRRVEEAVHQLRSETTDLYHSLDRRLLTVEDTVGNETKGLVNRVNKHGTQIDRMQSIFMTYLPIFISVLAIVTTAWLALRG